MSISAMSGSGATAESITFDYMNLLITQLRNQNPLEPMDNNQMASQLSQLASLEQLEQINGNFEKALAAVEISQAATLVGKRVGYPDPETGLPETGLAQRVEVNDGNIQLVVSGKPVDLATVTSVSN
jgi:flagellar basal-body rod modification protein FlgD